MNMKKKINYIHIYHCKYDVWCLRECLSFLGGSWNQITQIKKRKQPKTSRKRLLELNYKIKIKNKINKRRTTIQNINENIGTQDIHTKQ